MYNMLEQEENESETYDLTNIENLKVKDVFEEIASHFDITRVYKWTWIIDFFEKLKHNSLIYDLGCGNGRNMEHNNLKFIGVDNCESFINICKKIYILFIQI